MKITITDDDGLVIEIIEDVEQYDLDKPMAASELISEIKRAISTAK